MKTRIVTFITTAMLFGNFALLASACAHEGPAQRAGRHVDNAAKDVKDGVKK
jgi:hypothetical protein